MSFLITLELVLLLAIQHWRKSNDSLVKIELTLYYTKAVKLKMTCVLILVYLRTTLNALKTLKRCTHTILE